MRRAAPTLALLAVLTAGCTAEAPPSPDAGPTGPCAAERVQPPEGSQEQRVQGDLDGDGRTDEVVSWLRDGQRVVQAWLATGENAVPEALFEGDLLSTADLHGDGRSELFVGAGAESGNAFVLDGCRLTPVTVDGTDQRWEYAFRPGAALLCRPNGLVEEAVTTAGQTARRAWTITGSTVTEAQPVSTGPVTTPGITCG